MHLSKIRWYAPALVALVALVAACGGSTAGTYTPGETDFTSATPGGNAGRGEYDSGAEGPVAGAPNEDGAGGGAPPRAVEEADIVRVDGTLLYVLNTYRGLQVIDVANPDQPALIGMAGIYGHPIEMYIRGTRAYVVVSNYYNYWMAEDALADSSVDTFRGSQIRVLDIADPTNPFVVGQFNVQGEITDTRIVGDVLYTVSNRVSWWWNGSTEDTQDGTWIVSIDISDPQNIQQVDEEAFPRSGWDNHVHVTPDAIYVASSGYTWDNNSGQYLTRLKYVDISDPAGQIALGGETFVTGFVRDRWMLDEYQGVFRAVTAPDWRGSPPEVHTFQMGAGGTFNALGHLALRIPRPESVTAVRFDGAKAYVVTYERVDPLFIIDLTDPANPLQRGELEMPGWLDHIAPRGDRLVALGHDDTNGWRMAVSLFDVSDMDLPTMIDRVTFGENWGWIPDERDNFDKVFRVLDDLGLVMIPFHSYGYDDLTGYWTHAGGVQLIDFSRTDLVERGLIDHAGFVKRAIPHGNRILTVSDELMQTVDATNRDAPRVTGSVELARNVVDFVTMGGYGVQLVGDWYRGDTRLLVVPLADPDLGAPLAEIQVTAPYGRMFVNGSHIYLVSRNWRTQETQVSVVDLTTPTAPRITGTVTLPEQVSYWGWYGGWWGGDELVQVGGDKLVFHSYRAWYRGYECGPAGCPDDQYDRLFVVDLSNPNAPALASTLILRDEDWVYGLKARGDTLFFTHYEWSGQDASGRQMVRYYLDRFDLSDPANPVRQHKVNVPGHVVDLSADGTMVYTLDYEYLADSQVRQSFNALRLLGRVASLEDRLYFDGYAGNVVFRGTTAWLSVQRNYQTGDRWNSELKLLAIDASASRNLRIAGEEVLPDQYGWLRTVEGNRAFVDLGWMGGMLIYDVSNPADIRLDHFFRHQGWINAVHVHGNAAFFAMGYYGVQGVSLAPR